MTKLKQISSLLYSQFSIKEIHQLLTKQLNQFFDLNDNEREIIMNNIPEILGRLELNISFVKNKYYERDNVPFFNPYHSGQYLTFLYFLSFHLSNKKNDDLADRIYFLNKILNSIDIYHKVQLPTKFFFEHPLGTVLGRAKYGENLFAMQGCTIGGTENEYPNLGDNVSLYSYAKIIGNCNIGKNVIMSANSYIKDVDIEENTIVFGQYPNHILKTNKKKISLFITESSDK